LVKTAKSTDIEDMLCELPDGIVIAIPRWMTDAGRGLPIEILDFFFEGDIVVKKLKRS
jgi:hypothetical protein